MSYIIEHGIPAPSRGPGRHPSHFTVAIRTMSSGDSVIIPACDSKDAYLLAYKVLRAQGRRLMIIVRRANRRGDVRLWLTEPRSSSK